MNMARLILCAAALLVLSVPNAAMAQSKIVAVVNDEPITSLDVNQRARVLTLIGQARGNARNQALEMLIDDLLVIQAARRRNLSVDDSQVDSFFASRAKAARLSPAQMQQALRQRGVNPRAFKDFLRGRMTYQRYTGAVARSRLRVTEQRLSAALKKKGDGAQTSTQYELKQIIFVLPEKASAALVRRRETEANALRRRFDGCEEGEKLARSLKEVVVRSAGRRSIGEIQGRMRKIVKDTPIGKASKPIRSPLGLEMIAVCSKREIASDADARIEIGQDLRTEQADAMQKRVIRDLRQDAIIVRR
ncbi:SurA N-terminal domain-containing protein [Coralliovum pocilloporae]|uniref:SurA N-terminal domain-containing protein n=1 Tax=Coralliovum pocilloporae TaxID=3066369 RepID=UPI003307A3B8